MIFSTTRAVRPLFYCVSADPLERCRVAQDLIRPDEVQNLIRGPERTAALWFGTSAAVSLVLKTRISEGRLRYEEDSAFCDLWRSPKLTLALGYGDCEDHAFIAASLCPRLGCEPVFVVGRVYNRGRWAGHAWIEGVDKYGGFMIETTTGAVHRRRPEMYVASLFIGRNFFRRAA